MLCASDSNRLRAIGNVVRSLRPIESCDGDRSISGSGQTLYFRSAFLLSLFFLHSHFTVLTAASASPFALGCFGLTRACSKLYLLAKFSNCLPVYWLPQSVTNFAGMPCRLKCSFRTSMVSRDVRSFSLVTSLNLE